MTNGIQNFIREAALWLMVFVISLAGFFYLDGKIGAFMTEMDESAVKADPSQSPPFRQKASKSSTEQSDGDGRVVLHAGQSGHFRVKAYVNEDSVEMVADTGATYIALTYEDAEQLDLTGGLEFTGRSKTANGIAKFAPVLLSSVEVGEIEVTNVKAIIMEPGKLHISLLGMSFIGRLERFEMSGRELVLIQ